MGMFSSNFSTVAPPTPTQPTAKKGMFSSNFTQTATPIKSNAPFAGPVVPMAGPIRPFTGPVRANGSSFEKGIINQQVQESERAISSPTFRAGLAVKGKSGLRAGAEEAGYATIPTAAALAGGVAAGEAAAPLGAVPVVGPALVIGASLAGAIAAGWGAEKLQKQGIKLAIGERRASNLELQRQATEQQHPTASFIGGAVPQLIAMKPSPKNVLEAGQFAKSILTAEKGSKAVQQLLMSPEGKQQVNNLVNVAVGGGTQFSQELYNEVQSGKYSATRLVATTVMGLLLNEPNKLGVKLGMHPSGDLTVKPDVKTIPTEIPPVKTETKIIPKSLKTVLKSEVSKTETRPQTTEKPKISLKTNLSQPKPEVQSPLHQEALKYKSAEEFVKAKESDYLYHGTNKTTLENIQKEGIVPQRRGVSSFSKSEDYSRNWSDNPYTKTEGVMFRIKKDALDGSVVKRKGSMPETDKQFEVLTNKVVSPKDIEVETPSGWRSLTTNELSPSKSQLTSIYNEAHAAKTESQPKAKSEVVYTAKQSLGKNTKGEEVLARTETNAKTGEVKIYYKDSLAPELKEQALNHEYGHYLDKKIGGGDPISAEVTNYNGNKAHLDEVLGKYGEPAEVSKAVAKDIITLSDNLGSTQGERWANATREYLNNPEEAVKKAPTLSKILADVGATKPNVGGKMAEAPIVTKKGTATAKIAGTNLDTGKRVKTKSFNPKSINAPEEVDKLFGQMSEGAENQRISKTNEDIKDLSRMVGLKEEDLLKAKPGSIANAETVTAARQLVIDKSQELLNYMKGIDTATATADQLATFKEKFVKLLAMQRSIAGFRTEASNVFRSLGIEVIPGENATLEELMGKMMKLGVASEGDASLFAMKVAKEFNPTLAEKIGSIALDTWYASILSGPKTTVRNVVDTMANMLTDITSKAANPKTAKEALPAMLGFIRGIVSELPATGRELKNILTLQPTTEMPGKFVDRAAFKEAVYTGKWAYFGRVTEIVGKILGLQDKLMSAGAREAELSALGRSNPEVDAAIAQAVAKDYAETAAFHGTPKGTLMLSLRNAAQALRKDNPVSRIIVPFVDTVANVVDRTFDYVPVISATRFADKPMTIQAERIAREHGLSRSAIPEIKTRLRDQQIGRAVLGGAVTVAGVALAAKGKISGNGPSKKAENDELQATGWRPNSIKIGDTWVPYTNLGPLRGVLSMIGNIHDSLTYDKTDDKTAVGLITAGIIGYAKSTLNMSFLSGIGDLFDVLNSNTTPESYLRKEVAGLIGAPAIYTQTRDLLTGSKRYEIRDVKDALEAKWSPKPKLEPLLNALGDPATTDAIYQMSPSREKNDPVYRFLVDNNVSIGKPSPKQKYKVGPGEEKALTPKQYTAYLQKSGARIKNYILKNQVSLSRMDQDKRDSTISTEVSNIREQERLRVVRQVQ